MIFRRSVRRVPLEPRRGPEKRPSENEAASSHGGATRPRRRVVEDSPRAPEGFAASVPGEDSAGGGGGSDASVRGSPRGEGPRRTVSGVRPPRGEGPDAATRVRA